MALLHQASAPAAPECLELFKLAETQTGVIARYVIEVPPISTQEGVPLEFYMRPDSPDYQNLKGMRLCGRLRIVHSDGSHLGAGEVAVPINFILQTAWKQVDVKLGNMIISSPQQMNPYKALIKFTLTKGSETKKTQAATEGYIKDTAGFMDACTVENTAIYDKTTLYELSKWVDFEGPLMEDCLDMDRYLVNNVPISVKLTPASSEFCIMAVDKTKKYKLEYSELRLKMAMVTVSPGVLLGHANALKESNALYPFTKGNVLNFSVPRGDSNVTLHNFCTKSVPTRIVFAMVSAEAFNGSYWKNPFNFHHYNVCNISLIVNETIVGGQPLKVNFDAETASGRDYVNAYNNMFAATGTEGENFGNDITIEDFAKGYALFCFNLEPFTKPGKYLNLVKTGFVRLSVQFSKPLPETIVLIIYCEHQDMFQVDAAKNVILI